MPNAYHARLVRFRNHPDDIALDDELTERSERTGDSVNVLIKRYIREGLSFDDRRDVTDWSDDD